MISGLRKKTVVEVGSLTYNSRSSKKFLLQEPNFYAEFDINRTLSNFELSIPTDDRDSFPHNRAFFGADLISGWVFISQATFPHKKDLRQLIPIEHRVPTDFDFCINRLKTYTGQYSTARKA